MRFPGKCGSKMPKISVIMLTYNREEMLGKMIESICRQTFRDFEFLIIDNGSVDRSGEIAEQYAKKDERIRVFHTEKRSIGAGRNLGLSYAAGDYVAFVDDDDSCAEDYLEFLYTLAEEKNAEVAIAGTDRKHMEICRVFAAQDALVQLLDRKLYNTGFPTKLIKKELFCGKHFPEDSNYDDIYLMPFILADANVVAYHGLAKYYVNRHEHNNSAWTTNYTLLTEQILREYLAVYRSRTEWLCGRFPDSAEEWWYFEWSFMISMVEKITHYKPVGCQELREELVSVLRECREEFVKNNRTSNVEKEWMEELL